MQRHEQWLIFAEDDAKTAKLILESEDINLGYALYHMQQCAEKALKAYLIIKKQPLKKTHDLVELTNTCIDLNQEFNEIIMDAVELNPYSIKTRYPDDLFFLPNTITAQENLKQALKILNFVRSKLTEE